MTDLLFIHWNPDPVAFSILGREIRWYGLCWCAGLLLGYLVMQRLYRQQGIPKEKFEPLFLYVFVGVLAGARLGHCLFYEPGYFLTHPLQMILPMKETFEGWRCTGYEGLSSHGGVFGMFVSLWLYIRKYKVNAMRVLDNMGICAPLTACFIRLGNLFNSEIVGKTTDMPWGFVFAANGDTVRESSSWHRGNASSPSHTRCLRTSTNCPERRMVKPAAAWANRKANNPRGVRRRHALRCGFSPRSAHFCLAKFRAVFRGQKISLKHFEICSA